MGQKSDRTNPARGRILSVMLDEILVRLRVVLPVLLHDILADVAVHFLGPSCNLQLILGRDGRHLPSFSHQIQYELGDIPTSDGDMFDRTSDDIPFSARDNVSNTIARVNDSSSESTVCDLVGRPGGSKGEHCLNGDVEALDIERFEKNLGSLFTVLRCVEGRFGLELAMKVRFCTAQYFRNGPVGSSDPLAPPSDT